MKLKNRKSKIYPIYDAGGAVGLNEQGGIGENALRGAATGASIGSVAGPWGTVIGGAVGAIGGAAYGSFAEGKQRKLAEQIRQADFNQSTQDAVLRGQQLQSNPMYSLSQRRSGGKLEKYPLGGEIYVSSSGKTYSKSPDKVDRYGHITYPQQPDDVIVGQNSDGTSVIREGELQDILNRQNPKRKEILARHQIIRTPTQIDSLKKEGFYAKGGKLSRLSNNTVLAEGRTHEEGGIKLPSMKAEVEDNETMKKLKDGGTYVFSDTLINPNTGNTFAKDDTKLSRIKGRIEKNSDSRFKKAALGLIKDREQSLLDTHESVRVQSGLESSENTQVAKQGGRLRKGLTEYNPNMYYQAFPDGGYLQKIKTDSGVKYIYDKNQVRPDELPSINTIQPEDNLSLITKPLSIPNQKPTHDWNRFTPTARKTDTVSFGTKDNLPNNDPRNKNKKFAGGGPIEDDMFQPETNINYFLSQRNPRLNKIQSKSISSPEPTLNRRISVGSGAGDYTGIGSDKFSTSPTKGSGFSSKLAKGLSAVAPFADNVSGALFNYNRSQQVIPNKRTLTALNPSYVNYGQAIKDTRDNIRSFNKGIDQTNANSGNANIMKAFALGEQGRQLARISQEENNVNTGIANEFAGRNKEIEARNAETDFENAERRRIGADEINREYQQNIVNASNKFQNIQRDKMINKQLQDQADVDLMGKDPRVRKLLGKRTGGKLSKMYC